MKLFTGSYIKTGAQSAVRIPKAIPFLLVIIESPLNFFFWNFAYFVNNIAMNLI